MSTCQQASGHACGEYTTLLCFYGGQNAQRCLNAVYENAFREHCGLVRALHKTFKVRQAAWVSVQMDALDPGKFIMWLMAGVLASCWLILLIKSTLPSDWYSAPLSIPHPQQLIAHLVCCACAQHDKLSSNPNTPLEICNIWSF